MRKYLLFLLPTLLLAAGCTQELENRLDQVESRVSDLETRLTQLNEQVSAIRALLSGVYFVRDIQTLSDGSGYKLILENGSGQRLEKTILHGKDGVTPELGIRQHTDGNYYWTLNGEWLLSGGQKVRANGEDAPAAEFKVEDGKWYMKVGEGAWTYVGDAVTEVQGPIVAVDATSRADVVLFTLRDGTVLEIPRAGTEKLQLLLDENAFVSMKGGETRSTPYEVKAPAGVGFLLDSYEPQGWKVSFSAPEAKTGTLSITLPADAIGGKVMLVATGSDGSCFVRVLHVGDPDAGDYVETTTMVDAGAGTLDLPSGAASVSIPPSATWLQLSGNRLVYGENSSYDARSAVVTFKVGSQAYSLKLVQAQKDAIVLTENSLTVDPEGEELPFVLLANVEVKASSNVEWMQIAPVTKGLEDKPFVITVQANKSGQTRKGVLTFSSGDLSQAVSVAQDPDEDNPLLKLNTPGAYLEILSHSYSAGADQYIRSYDGTSLTFVILNRKEGGTIAIRVPNDAFLQNLLGMTGTPIYSTSVNIAGEPSLHSLSAICKRFESLVDVVVRGDEMQGKVPSTLIDATVKPYKLVRQGLYDASALIRG